MRASSTRCGNGGKTRPEPEPRQAFSKRFRDSLIARHDSRDAITGERYEARCPQIDHRLPYEVTGDSAHDRPEDYMPLNASSQRAKSWSCEQCANWREDRNPETCGSCFRAFPENYGHVAGERMRRADIEWRGSEIESFAHLRDKAEEASTTIAAVIKKLLAEAPG